MLCPACLGAEPVVFSATPKDREYFNVRLVATSIMRCVICDSLFQRPWPNDEEICDFYGADYQNYATTSVPLLAKVNAGYQRIIGRRFRRTYGHDIAVLDFGCGQGSFLRTLEKAGYIRLVGFDFVLYRELSSIRGVRFFDNLRELQASGLRFDVIRMNHVIEHLTDIDGVMRLLVSLLAPGGSIIGQTPNAAHYTARLMGAFWGGLHYPYHTLIFSPKGLKTAALRWGLGTSATSGALLPTGWAMSWENFFKEIFASRHRGRSAAYVILMALGAPLALVDWVLSPRATANFNFELKRLERK